MTLEPLMPLADDPDVPLVALELLGDPLAPSLTFVSMNWSPLDRDALLRDCPVPIVSDPVALPVEPDVPDVPLIDEPEPLCTHPVNVTFDCFSALRLDCDVPLWPIVPP